MSLLLYVSVGGVTHPLEVEPMAAVRDLQNALQAALGRQPRQLSFQGRVLQPEALLADEGVCQESRLEEISCPDPLFDTQHHGSHVSFPQRGSGPLGREASRLEGFRLGLVLTAAPVAGPGVSDGGFMVMITERSSSWTGTLKMGLISSSPAELPFADYVASGWRGLSGTCTFDTSSVEVEVGNVLLCRRTDCGMHAAVLSTEGAVLVNRLFEMESELQSAVLYGFCDIYAKTQSVKLLWQTGCGPPPVPLPAPPPPPDDAAPSSSVTADDVVVSLACDDTDAAPQAPPRTDAMSATPSSAASAPPLATPPSSGAPLATPPSSGAPLATPPSSGAPLAMQPSSCRSSCPAPVPPVAPAPSDDSTPELPASSHPAPAPPLTPPPSSDPAPVQPPAPPSSDPAPIQQLAPPSDPAPVQPPPSSDPAPVQPPPSSDPAPVQPLAPPTSASAPAPPPTSDSASAPPVTSPPGSGPAPPSSGPAPPSSGPAP